MPVPSVYAYWSVHVILSSPNPPFSPLPHRGSIWLSSFMSKISFCRYAALSSKPSLASAAMSLPSALSASGFTWSSEGGEGGGGEGSGGAITPTADSSHHCVTLYV